MTSIDPMLAGVIVLGGVAALAAAVNQVMGIVDRVKGRPGTPPNESLAIQVANLERRVESIEGKQDSMIREARSDRDELLRAGEQRASHIHDRLNNQAALFSEQLRMMETKLSAKIGELQGELRRMK